MRRSHLLVVGLGMTAAAATGSAFTAANSLPASVAGYGQATITGATVTDIDYVPYSLDNTDVETVIFQSSTDVTGKTASLTLKSGTTVVGTFSCTLGAFATSMDITCDTSVAHPDFSSFDTVGLTVVD
jgi:hypothetical protein